MYSVVITNKRTGTVAAQVRISLRGQNYTPSPAEYQADAWRIAIDGQLVAAAADKADYTFEIVPVSIHDVFSSRG